MENKKQYLLVISFNASIRHSTKHCRIYKNEEELNQAFNDFKKIFNTWESQITTSKFFIERIIKFI